MTYAEKLYYDRLGNLFPLADHDERRGVQMIEEAMQAQREADANAALNAIDVAMRQEGKDPYNAVRAAILNAKVQP